jgi:TPR repeat protein
MIAAAAYDKGDYATALRLWQPLAEQGDVRAQTNLGLMFYTGQGVPQDLAVAVTWYRKAAEQGAVRR